VNQQLRAILAEVGGLSKPADSLGATDDLFSAGLTSFATVAVMLAIEDEFDVEFPDALLVRATFRSLESLGEAIAGLKGQAVAV
jgi:acyl carrier protein